MLCPSWFSKGPVIKSWKKETGLKTRMNMTMLTRIIHFRDMSSWDETEMNSQTECIWMSSCLGTKRNSSQPFYCSSWVDFPKTLTWMNHLSQRKWYDFSWGWGSWSYFKHMTYLCPKFSPTFLFKDRES